MNSGSLRTKIIYFFREDDSEDIQLLLANNSQSREGNSTLTQAKYCNSRTPTITTTPSKPPANLASRNCPT